MSESKEAKSGERMLLIADDSKHYYFNGFSVSVAAGDVVITLTRHGKPELTLNTSFTVAKTFANAIGSGIATLEERTGNKIMTIEDIRKALKG